jgi:hypothetical protein
MAIGWKISFPHLNPIFRVKMKLLVRTIFMNNAVPDLRLVSGLLLVAYSSVFLFSPGIVPHHDHDHVIHDTDTCEKDPCHISIYHHGDERGCSHKYHFTAAPEKCVWCDVILACQMTPVNVDLCQEIHQFSSCGFEYLVATDLLIPFCNSGRGPPAYIAC